MDDRRGQGLAISRKLGLAVSLAALFFVGRWLWQVEPATWASIWDLNGWWLIGSLGLFQVWFIIRYLAWEFISHRHGYAGPRHENIKMWVVSELLRYIPGNVWSFAGRYRGARQGGVARSGSIQAIILEALGLMTGAAIVSVLTIRAPLVWLAPVIILGPVFFGPQVISLVFRMLRKASPQILSRREVMTIVFFYVLVWVVFGLSHVMLFHAMRGWLGPVSLWSAVSVSVLSWLIGYASLITPMGLGVREATMAKLLESRSLVNVSTASVVAVVSRVWLVMSELVFLGIVVVWSRTKR